MKATGNRRRYTNGGALIGVLGGAFVATFTGGALVVILVFSVIGAIAGFVAGLFIRRITGG